MRRFILRLWHAVRPSRGERDLAREVAPHLALLTDDFVRRGMSADEARYATRRALGSTALTMDRQRDARSFVWLDALRRDLALAARLLRRNPAFAATAGSRSRSASAPTPRRPSRTCSPADSSVSGLAA